MSLEDNTAAEDVEAAVVEPEDAEEGPPPPVWEARSLQRLNFFVLPA